MMRPVIITGGPGSGKTTLIRALSHKGYATFDEASRTLIEEQSQLVDGILPWQDMAGFAALCLDVMTEQKRKASEYSTAFLDRAIPDICGYLLGAGIEPDKHYLAASKGYFPAVFFCRPDKNIYVQDDVRPYPYEEALVIHDRLVDTYQRLGYRCIDVPFSSVEDRIIFVSRELSNLSTKIESSPEKISREDIGYMNS